MFRVAEADLRVGFPPHAVRWLVVLENSSRQRRYLDRRVRSCISGYGAMLQKEECRPDNGLTRTA